MGVGRVLILRCEGGGERRGVGEGRAAWLGPAELDAISVGVRYGLVYSM